MKLMRKQLLVLAMMLASSGLAAALHPRHRIADQGPKVDLNAMVPVQFASWKELPQANAQIINPEQTEMIHKIYTETLSRTYVNPQGEGIMLTIAYGASQSDGVGLHYPEICYPAQGFALMSQQPVELATPFGPIAAKQLFTRLGNRSEPVTYWATMGNKVVRGSMQTKLTQLKFGFQGDIPDGLLFRVSSITDDPDAGYRLQQRFVQELLPAISAQARLKLAGLPNPNER